MQILRTLYSKFELVFCMTWLLSTLNALFVLFLKLGTSSNRFYRSKDILRTKDTSSQPEVFLKKGVLKICSKFTWEHPCWSVISIKLQSNFIEIALQHGCSPVNLLYIFRIPSLKNTSGQLLFICPEYLVTETLIIAMQDIACLALWKIHFQDWNSHFMKLLQTRFINATHLKTFRAIFKDEVNAGWVYC